MKPTREQLRVLLGVIDKTAPQEIDCHELLAGIGALLESLEAGERPPAELHQVRQHLEVCPPCAEEFDALMLAYGVSPDPPR